MAAQSRASRSNTLVGGSQNSELGEPHTVSLPQGQVQYRERGTGPTLLFVHGLYVNGDLWRKVVPELGERYRCVTIDLPFGSHAYPMAEDADLSPEGIADLMADFIAELGLTDLTVIANDTGIGYTQVFVANHPDKLSRLVLTPGDVLWNFLAVPIKWMRPVSMIPGGMTFITYFWNSALGRALIMPPLSIVRQPETVLDSWFQPATRNLGVRRDLEKLIRAARPRSTYAALRKLHHFTGPSVILWNATGNLIFPRRHAGVLQAALSDARIEMIPNTRAFMSEDQPAWLAAAVDRFIMSTTGAP